MTVPLSVTEAALGTFIDVPTLEGVARVTVPAAAAAVGHLRIAGRGRAQPSGGQGHLWVDLAVEVPRAATGATEAALRGLEAAAGDADYPRRAAYRAALRGATTADTLTHQQTNN